MSTRFRSRNAVAIQVDVILLAVLLLLFSPRLTGLPVHEWIGLTVGAVLLVHLLLSWSWISAGTRRFIAERDRRARVNYVLNALLFILVVVEVTSGIVISRVSLPSLGILTIEDRSWRALHNLTLNWTMLLLGFHVAMNWRPFAGGVKRVLTARAPASE